MSIDTPQYHSQWCIPELPIGARQKLRRNAAFQSRFCGYFVEQAMVQARRAHRWSGEYNTAVKWHVLSVAGTHRSSFGGGERRLIISRHVEERVQFNYTLPSRVSLVDHGIISAGCKCATINYTAARVATTPGWSDHQISKLSLNPSVLAILFLIRSSFTEFIVYHY